MKGRISEEALAAYSSLVAELYSDNFSEYMSEYDFTRCVRANGSAYGTGGKCRLGTEEAKEIQPSKKHKEVANTGSNGEKKTKMRITAKIKALPTEKLYKVLIDPRITDSQKKLLQKHIDERKKQEEIKPPPKAKTQTKSDETMNKPEAKTNEPKKEVDFETAQQIRDERQRGANLSEKEKNTILEYTTATEDEEPRSYRAVNKCLRYPKSCRDSTESQKFVKELDSAIRKLPKNGEGNEFYRAVDADGEGMDKLYKTFENIKPGAKVKDPGYGSYSAERGAVNSFVDGSQRSILFVSRNRNLTPINEFSEWKQENEAVLPRGTEQTVRKVTKEGGNLIVEFE